MFSNQTNNKYNHSVDPIEHLGGEQLIEQAARYSIERGFNIPWVGGQNTMDRESKYHIS
jgi:hypothetical protein